MLKKQRLIRKIFIIDILRVNQGVNACQDFLKYSSILYFSKQRTFIIIFINLQVKKIFTKN
jgi:hypothetical protein